MFRFRCLRAVSIVLFFASGLRHAAAANPKSITYLRQDGIFSLKPTMDLWPSKENYSFGNYFIFVSFRPPDGSPAQFQVQIFNKKYPEPTDSGLIDRFTRQEAARVRDEHVAINKPTITRARISGYDARRLQYTMESPKGRISIAYTFFNAGPFILAIVDAVGLDQAAKYRPIFRRMQDSIKIDLPHLRRAFPG